MKRRHQKSLMASLLGSLAALLLFSACGWTTSCVSIGCPQDQVCNESTGDCETPSISNCNDADVSCPDGQRCDSVTGRCRPLGAKCPEQTCPAGQRCNMMTGFCEDIFDCDPQVNPCTSPAEVCDQVTNRCVPKSCESDPDCGSSHYCSEEGRCQDGCRPQESNCPDGQFCRILGDQEIGQCTEQCSDDSECPVGQLCQRSGDGFVCMIQPCENDIECRGEAVCRNEFCMPPPCSSDGDCRGGDVCDVATGQCLGGSCDDDDRAPNHVIAEATEIETTTLQGTLCPGRPDWYAFDLRSSDVLRITLEQGDADADLDVYVYAEDRELIGLNQQTSLVTEVTLISRQRQTAYIEVRGSVDQSRDYSITVERNPDFQCRDDANEENDSRREAVEVSTTPGLLTNPTMTICGPDEDWFALRDLDETLGLSLELDGSETHVRADLLGPEGAVLPLDGTDTTQLRRLDVRRLGVSGDYFIRVRSAQNRIAEDLSLAIEVEEPIQCADARQFSTPDTAFEQAPGPPPSDPGSLCPLQAGWEVDWMKLEAPSTPVFVYVQLTPSEGLPWLNIDLFRRVAPDSVEPVRRAVRRTTPDGAIYEMRAPMDPSDAFFVRLSADGEPGRIIEQVNYKIFYSFEPR